jgi:hypothetical protein
MMMPWLFRLMVSVLPMVDAATLPVPEVQVIVMERQNSGISIKTMYAPQLAMIRLEIGNRVTVIDLPHQLVWWLAKQNHQLVNEQSFSQLIKSEQTVRLDTKKFTGFEIPALETLGIHDWQLQPSSVEYIRNQQPAFCQTVELKNRSGEIISMCVRQDQAIQRLEFMEKYFEQLPTQLKRDLESSEEIFLYSQGLLPVLWKRRGRSFELRSIKHESVAMTFFRKPSEYEKSAPRYAAEESYFDAMKRASKSLKLKNRKNH